MLLFVLPFFSISGEEKSHDEILLKEIFERVNNISGPKFLAGCNGSGQSSYLVVPTQSNSALMFDVRDGVVLNLADITWSADPSVTEPLIEINGNYNVEMNFEKYHRLLKAKFVSLEKLSIDSILRMSNEIDCINK